MTRQEIIDELAALTEPKRLLDQAIAELFKYRREKTTEPGTGRERINWYHPNGQRVGLVPYFTAKLDDAKSLFDYAHPNVAGGFSWHDGYARAQLSGEDPVAAFNPASALCLATIKAWKNPDE